MIGLKQRSVEWWKMAKAEGWDLDATTLRNLEYDLQADIADHKRVANGIADASTRKEFDGIFADDLATAETALKEISAALVARLARTAR